MTAVSGGKVWSPEPDETNTNAGTVDPYYIPHISWFKLILGGVGMTVIAYLIGKLYAVVAFPEQIYNGGPLTPENTPETPIVWITGIYCILVAFLCLVCIGAGLYAIVCFKSSIDFVFRLIACLLFAAAAGTFLISPMGWSSPGDRTVSGPMVEKYYGYQSVTFNADNDGEDTEATVVMADGTEKTVEVLLNEKNEYLLFDDRADFLKHLAEQYK